MFNSKNLSPARLAFFISLIITLLVSMFLFFFTRNLQDILITFAVVGIVSYLLIYYVIERFIYRKIKLIYKFISQTKATKREEYFANELLPQKTIEEVRDEVTKWAEERKVEIERLQNNEQFRREFLMNLAHELKTPIFAAQGYIDTLLNGAIHDDNVNITFLQKAGKSIDRLSDLVTDLDEISKIESNQLPINKSSFMIQDLIKDVYEELSQKATIKKIKLGIKKGCEQDIEVVADLLKIKQVLVNLIENSINYGKENGETNAGVYIVDSKQVFIEITDDGIGINDEHISRVFERFYRTDSARSRNAGGTGLGLAIVKHIVEAHNHSVTCRSKLDVGTSFGFTLDRE
ncbi:MAG: sensor histidine kinase [Chitinophagaceae bacterium]|jgi:two-component system phosphate regulon sensor histidine kinase PhoR|nr:sensor histidine kinase [Chitinophagaceae bacterium]